MRDRVTPVRHPPRVSGGYGPLECVNEGLVARARSPEGVDLCALDAVVDVEVEAGASLDSVPGLRSHLRHGGRFVLFSEQPRAEMIREALAADERLTDPTQTFWNSALDSTSPVTVHPLASISASGASIVCVCAY